MTALRPQPIVRFSLMDQVLHELRRQILQAELPPLAPLPEAHFAKALHVSRVPVREALMQLERDGLTLTTPLGKSSVRLFSAEDVLQLSAVRRELEGMAARLACETARPSDLQVLRSNIAAFADAGSPEELARLDVEFHEGIVQAACQPWLMSAWVTLRWPFETILVRSFREYVEATSLEESKVSTADHGRIVDAIEARDASLAEMLLRQHIVRWEEWTSAS